MPQPMTYATLRRGAEFDLAVKTERGVLDVRAVEAKYRVGAPTTVEALLRDGGAAQTLARLVERAKSDPDAASFFIDAARAEFGPCVPHPPKIVCVGLNYRRHAQETGNPIPTVPILFSKFNNALNHHDGSVKLSALPTEQLDYEAELVVVMGRRAQNVAPADALKYVFGYCVGNDVSARDLQMRTSQWLLGKTCDGFAPIGPYLVSADQVPDPNRLAIECRVNGAVRQSSNTNDMVFDCAALIAYASRHFPLEPGDLLFTGTPEGVILGYPKEKRVWLKPGDRVTTSIEKLGTLEFTVT
jgi:2-keto-4-pentenoate hydratase/2-oxohepta-3-ene-1,7-dioic acid hydratase in catechol pathway